MRKSEGKQSDLLEFLNRVVHGEAAAWQQVVAQVQMQFGAVAFDGTACEQHGQFTVAVCQPAKCAVQLFKHCSALMPDMLSYWNKQTPLGLRAATLRAFASDTKQGFTFAVTDFDVELPVRIKVSVCFSPSLCCSR